MAILVDVSQICIANLMISPNIKKNQIDSLLIKHMILNSIRLINLKFRKDFGQLIICCDARYTWRHKTFIHYKSKRKSNRAESPYDWKLIYEAINSMKSDLKMNFPYKVIEIESDFNESRGAEADDIIGTLAKNLNEPTLIVSSDKDMTQLLRYPNVRQYAPIKRKFVTTDNPIRLLNGHIIRGDVGDGIPNILSDSDTFIADKRQTPINTKKIEKWLDMKPEEFCENSRIMENYSRNKELIDLSMIPQDIQDKIMQAYSITTVGDRITIMKYFINNRMKMLMEDIGDF